MHFVAQHAVNMKRRFRRRVKDTVIESAHGNTDEVRDLLGASVDPDAQKTFDVSLWDSTSGLGLMITFPIQEPRYSMP